MKSKSEQAREKLYQDEPDFSGAMQLMTEVAESWQRGEKRSYACGALWVIHFIAKSQGCEHVGALMKLHETHFE